MKMIFGLALFGVVYGFSNCVNIKDNYDVGGVWYLIRQDSIYEENIFTVNRVWAYDENAGEMIYQYDIKGDSLVFISPGGKISMSSKVEAVSIDEFILRGNLFDLHYHRLNTQIDTSKLINGDAEALNLYIEGFEARRHTWLNNRKR